MASSNRDTSVFHLDMPLLLGLLLLSATGLTVLYSAGGQEFDIVIRQGIRMALGFGLLIFVAQIRTQYIKHWVPWVYSAGVLLLLAVLTVGEVSKGARRWLDLGFLQFQPSELMKLAVPMMVAWYLAERPLPPGYKHLLIAAGLIFVPTLLIAKQPDLGTALLVAVAGVFVVFLSGLGWRLISGLGLLAVAGATALWYSPLLHDYQRQRVLTLFDPEQDPLGTGYHIIQSKIAIGSGGIYGKGWLNGTQSHLEFLPERHTDFIFAVFSEEFGLIGAVLLLTVYLLVVSRALYLSAHAQETFGKLLAGSIALTFFVYIFVNMGMVSGILPVVGVPLPLLSYGGTSLVTMMAGFGLLMGAHTHRRLLSG